MGQGKLLQNLFVASAECSGKEEGKLFLLIEGKFKCMSLLTVTPEMELYFIEGRVNFPGPKFDLFFWAKFGPGEPRDP